MADKYAAAHERPLGPGDQRPTALQVIKDEGLEGKLEGKVVLITGCSAGLGVETARAMLATGATLYLTARNLPRAREALGEVAKSPRVNLLSLIVF
ncbi:oxidoreductase [Colletotrichum truncatum]|uniref:Oxidoreductase n=1 Tax=Colletotrichum truncatum TaxID=5467 RepID=A0ACC3YRE6_COLTU